MLYEPAQFEPLIEEPWDPARIEDGVAAIVADADAAFDPEELWPAHEWDGWEEPLPMKNLYVGAAGVIWALDEFRLRGNAATSLDLAAAALRTLELKRAAPDFTADEHYHPASLLAGETGPLLVAFRLASNPSLADDLHALVRANVDNPTDDVMWGAPGTLLAALAMGEWTGEPHWEEAARETAAALQARRGDDGLWRQDDDYRGLGTLHGAAGNGFALLKAFERTGDERWLERARRFGVHALAQAERIAEANGRRRYSLFTGDVGTALFAAACLDQDARYPIFDTL